MKFVFRADASVDIGIGHIMRCLTLAAELRAMGEECFFICREHKGNLVSLIENRGFDTHTLPMITSDTQTKEHDMGYVDWLGGTQQQDAKQCQSILEKIKPDWLIVDHYAIDQVWQDLLKDTYKRLMVIDDLADRVHKCDLLLDQTHGREFSDYGKLVPKSCLLLLGSKYALLRPDFSEWRDYSLKRRVSPGFKKLLITMGGADGENITGQLLREITNIRLPKDVEITVVMGEAAPYLSAVTSQALTMPYNVKVMVNVNNMAEIMANSDLAIGAAGTTTWERACLGLPSIIIMLAENQKNNTNVLLNLNSVLVMDKAKLDSDIKMIEGISKETLLKLSQNTSAILDGQGTNRVVTRIQEVTK